MSRPQPPVWAVGLGFLAVYILWGSTYLAIKIVVETIPPFLGAAARHITAGIILFTILRLRGNQTPNRREWKSGFIVGGFLLLGGNGMLMWAEQTVPSGAASVIIATVPLFMVLFDTAVFRNSKLTPSLVLSLLLGLVGVGFLVWSPDTKDVVVQPLGGLVLIVASVSWALGSLLSRRLPMPTNSLMGTATQMLGGGALLVPFALLQGEASRLDVGGISTASLLALLYLIGPGSLIAFSCYTWILNHGTPAKVSTYAYVNPLVAIVLGVWLGQEELTRQMMIGAAAILLAVIVVVTLKRKKPAAGDPAAAAPAPAAPREA
jgi:drug/metabolite transporter (DMT)-like permease